MDGLIKEETSKQTGIERGRAKNENAESENSDVEIVARQDTKKKSNFQQKMNQQELFC